MKSAILSLAITFLLVDISVAATTNNSIDRKTNISSNNPAIVAGLFDDIRDTVNDVNGTVKDARGTVETTKDTKTEMNNLQDDVGGTNSSESSDRRVSNGHKFYDTVDEANNDNTNNEGRSTKKKDSSGSLDAVESLFK
jgi:hypothetical protein